ncbi:Scr1 family TA system antitoxin-like transcriptional regulator [Nocardia pseudovaccinii]|uniref:Scr1 family TA system antitoxin-like transcriptional regulator n=1 Tax=Nocardia pseudovaccinii TaxID=189540 RepID=UPI0007A46552|nr:Scr1 family TA system antitoxin-like transcriptional regulator [Nocardia pseudovaccinii]
MRDLAPLRVDLVLDEAVLRRVVGGKKVMSAQLRHLADLRPNVPPSARGFPLGISTGPFPIVDFAADDRGHPLEPPVVVVESYTGDIYLERPKSVRRYRSAFDVIQRVALDVPDSKRQLRQAAEEYAP